MLKKVLSSVIAFAIAIGTVTVIPAFTKSGSDIAVSASAANVTTYNGFIIRNNSYGKSIIGYNGNGGSITIPADVKYIEDKAFKYNTKIKTVLIPKKSELIGIGSEAFCACPSLKKVTVEDDIGYIGASAFSECVRLEEITFRGNITDPETNIGISSYAFSYCPRLKYVTFYKEDAVVDQIDSFAFFCCIYLQFLNFPSGLAKINNGAFLNCVNLHEVTIPSKTKVNGSYTFGYFQGFDTYKDFFNWYWHSDSPTYSGKEIKVLKANGSNTLYWGLPVAEESDMNGFKDVYYDPVTFVATCKYTPPAIVLRVAKGSPAETWAKNNDVKYSKSAESSGSSSSSSSSGSKLAAPKNIKTSRTSNSITLTWDSVKGADAYRVYKYNPSKDKYEVYKTVNSNKCKVTGLKSATLYQFKIVALDSVGKKYAEGKESAVVTVSTKAAK